MKPYALLCEPHVQPRVWGGRRLAELYRKACPPDEPIGELWEVADLPEGHSTIANGELAGQPLHAAVTAWGPDLLGTVWPDDTPRFPLLVKFLDAQEDLSVQVHPSDEDCRQALPEHHGKDETWVVLQSDGGGVIHDVARPVSWDRLAAAIDDETVFDHLRRVQVKPADVVRVAPGTIHALLSGVVVLEIQQPSDSTFRLYDYGRGRPLHLDEAARVANLDGGSQAVLEPVSAVRQGNRHERLVDVPAYRIERLRLRAVETWRVDPRSVQVLVVISGAATLRWSDGELALRAGRTVVLPAVLGNVTLAPEPEAEVVLAGAGGVPLVASSEAMG